MSKVIRKEVESENLQKDQRYFLDTHSQAKGVFSHKTLNEDGSLSISFRPIESGNYSVNKGLVTFRSSLNERVYFYAY